MGFLDKAKSAAEQAAQKAKEGAEFAAQKAKETAEDVQTKRELGNGYDDNLKFLSPPWFPQLGNPWNSTLFRELPPS